MFMGERLSCNALEGFVDGELLSMLMNVCAKPGEERRKVALRDVVLEIRDLRVHSVPKLGRHHVS